MSTPTDPGNGSPAEPSAPAADPSTPPAPKKSDFERLHESKEEWKQKAIAAEAEAERLRKEKQAAEDAKLKEKEDFKTLAEQKEAEAQARAKEAEDAKKRADEAEAKLRKVEEQQEAELKALLDGMPEDRRPPLDPADPIEKRLSLVKYALSMLPTGPKPAIGHSPVKKDADRLAELKAKKPSERTMAEDLELAELSGS